MPCCVGMFYGQKVKTWCYFFSVWRCKKHKRDNVKAHSMFCMASFRHPKTQQMCGECILGVVVAFCLSHVARWKVVTWKHAAYFRMATFHFFSSPCKKQSYCLPFASSPCQKETWPQSVPVPPATWKKYCHVFTFSTPKHTSRTWHIMTYQPP